MKYIYLGGLIPQNEVYNNPAASRAANKFEIGLVNSLSKECDVTVLSRYPNVSWPTGKVFLNNKRTIVINNYVTAKIIKYLNVKFIKEISTEISVYYELIKILKRNANNNEKTVVITYNGDGCFSNPIFRLKKRFDFIYNCIVVDPPLYDGTTTRSSHFWKILYKIKHDNYMNAAINCDKCVVLNKKCAIDLLHRKDYHVMDCGVSIGDDINVSNSYANKFWNKHDGKIHIVFTGSIHEHSGIMRLVDMMIEINEENFVLHIFGNGVFENKLKDLISEYDNIRFHGYLDGDDVKNIQHDADCLICPNIINHPINQYAFPSKLLEYMMSGTPVISTMVAGLRDEYFPFLYLYDDTIEGLRKTLLLIQKDRKKANEIGKAARDFVIKYKNWDVQAKKMLDYIGGNNR